MAYSGKYMKPSTQRPIQMGHVMMRIALVLLCLVMISFHLMGSMYARYSTKASSSDDARVAKFDVKVNGSDDVTVDCKVGEDGTYEITVNNESEVAVSYKITVNHDSVAGVSSSMDRDEGTLAAGASTQDNPHVLTFVVNWAEFTADVKNSDSKTVELAFSVTIDIVQVD